MRSMVEGAPAQGPAARQPTSADGANTAVVMPANADPRFRGNDAGRWPSRADGARPPKALMDP